MAPSDDVASFREALGTARQIGIIAGSGLSVASGSYSFAFSGSMPSERIVQASPPIEGLVGYGRNT